MRKFILPLAAAVLFSLQIKAQYLNGRVMNEMGLAAAKVNVNFTNKANTVSTNSDGTFKILASALPDTLVFSAPGYEPYKVVITEKNLKDPDFEVVLLDERAKLGSTLSEVVVTAMATKKSRKDVAYATISPSGGELAGKASGMVVMGYDRVDAGSEIRIRGSRSFDAGAAVDTRFYLKDTSIITKKMATVAGLLTAGEVNDFNKWKMWEEYSENEFRSMTNFWGMNTKKRFSVQLTDKSFNAIVNEPLFLVNKNTKDTVWKAVTDNTGKAELWAGFLHKDENTAYMIIDKYGHAVQAANEFSNGVNLLVADRSCGVTDEVDIAFVVDATGSMGDEIEFLKLELEAAIRNTMDKYKSLTLNAASVFYRDNGDEYVTKKVDFNDDLLKAINFIKLQGAGGGGDHPEAVDQALSVAIDSLKWNNNARTRLLFLVLDAPPHNEGKEKVQEMIVKAAAMGIRIIPIACSGTDKSTEFFLRSMALATNGTYTFLTDHSGIGNSHIEPTTDKYEMELLGGLLERIIGQYIYAKDCKTDNKIVDQQDIRQPENILSVKFYPNPTTGPVTIESKKELKEIFITDFTGKILMRIPAGDKKGKWTVNLSGYPSATYLIKYITEDNKWGAGKIVLFR